jgi:hypothetical protein
MRLTKRRIASKPAAKTKKAAYARQKYAASEDVRAKHRKAVAEYRSRNKEKLRLQKEQYRRDRGVSAKKVKTIESAQRSVYRAKLRMYWLAEIDSYPPKEFIETLVNLKMIRRELKNESKSTHSD